MLIQTETPTRLSTFILAVIPFSNPVATATLIPFSASIYSFYADFFFSPACFQTGIVRLDILQRVFSFLVLVVVQTNLNGIVTLWCSCSFLVVCSMLSEKLSVMSNLHHSSIFKPFSLSLFNFPPRYHSNTHLTSHPSLSLHQMK